MSQPNKSYPCHEEVETIYANRRIRVDALSKQKVIEADVLVTLDRLGRFTVVAELWTLCSSTAQNALLNDAHPHVRSAARLAHKEHNVLAGDSIMDLMRKHKVTIRDLAKRMNITLKRVREVRTTGVTGKCICQDWREAITGTGMAR